MDGRLVVFEHTWSDDGYGYAEPIDSALVASFSDAWSLFCSKANLDYQHAFADPSLGSVLGQLGLDL